MAESGKPLTNRFLSVTISQLSTGVQPPFEIQASLDNAKQKGRVSYLPDKLTTNPIELKLNPIAGGIINQKLIIELIAPGNDEDDEIQDQDDLEIGSFSMDLGPTTASLLNLTTYGYFSMPIQLLNEGQPSASCWLHLQINNRNFVFEVPENNLNVVLLPKHDPTFKFLWRIRVDVRQATDMPSGLNTFVQCNWTMAESDQYDPSTREEFFEIYRTEIRSNTPNPFYNTQFLINNPYYKLGGGVYSSVQGYLSFKILDIEHTTFDQVYFPISSLKPFIPLNIELQSVKKEFKIKPKYYLSLTLEQNPNDGKGLCDIIVHNFELNQQPQEDTSLQIMLTAPNFTPKNPVYTNMEIQSAGKLAKTLEKAIKPKELMFIGQMNSLQPIQSDQFYGAIAVFTLPISMLTSKLQLFAMSRDPKIKQTNILANTIIGNPESPIDQELLKQHQSDIIESKRIDIKWIKGTKLFDSFSKLQGAFEIGIFSQKDAQNFIPREQTPVISEPSHLSQVSVDDFFKSQKDDGIKKLIGSRNSLANSELNKAQVQGEEIKDENRSFKGSDISESQLGEAEQQMLELERWKVLSAELAQKQEIIHRMNKEIEYKTDNLKTTGEDITDLRKKIKVLRSENGLLQKRLGSEVELEANSRPTKEIWHMKPETLKSMVVKVATAYREERLKNEEFDKQIKEAYNQIIKAKHSSEELENLSKQRLQSAHKLTELKDLLGKQSVYRDTITKQEKIIQKMESAMEVTLKGTEQIKQREKELAQLKEECESLQLNMRNKVFSNATSELSRVKRENQKLESINKELLSQLNGKQRPSSTQNIDLYSETLELETQLYKISSKVEALQEELNRTAQDHARDIGQLRMDIAKKQAYINTQDGDY